VSRLITRQWPTAHYADLRRRKTFSGPRCLFSTSPNELCVFENYSRAQSTFLFSICRGGKSAHGIWESKKKDLPRIAEHFWNQLEPSVLPGWSWHHWRKGRHQTISERLIIPPGDQSGHGLSRISVTWIG